MASSPRVTTQPCPMILVLVCAGASWALEAVVAYGYWQ